MSKWRKKPVVIEAYDFIDHDSLSVPENEKQRRGCRLCPYCSPLGNCKRTGRYVGGYFGLDFVPSFCPLFENDKRKVTHK